MTGAGPSEDMKTLQNDCKKIQKKQCGRKLFLRARFDPVVAIRYSH
jgi:hypothetical protein